MIQIQCLSVSASAGSSNQCLLCVASSCCPGSDNLINLIMSVLVALFGSIWIHHFCLVSGLKRIFVNMLIVKSGHL